MKKLIAMLLALAMVFAMAACGATENKETEPATEIVTEATEEVTEEVTEEATEEVTEEIVEEEIVEEEDFVIELSAMETLLNSIVEVQPVEFMGMAMPVDLTDVDALPYFTGLTSAEGVVEAAVFEPMIGSIAFSMVAVQVAEGTDAAAVAEAMKSGIDTRKWICVEANDLLVTNSGDIALLVMVDSNNGLTAQSFVDAFNTVVAG